MLINLQRTATAVLALLLVACHSSMPPKPTASNTPAPASSDTSARPAPPLTPTQPGPSNGTGPKVINIDPKPETTGNPTDGIDPNMPLETSVTPKLEPIVPGTTKPYIVNGETMTPMTDVSTPYTQTGHASWYGKKFHGRNTASGEPYNMYKLTAAHRTLPIPSYIRITNLSNGKTLLARVNDRGPFGRDRIVDLSYAAAKQLDIIRHGSTQVQITLIDTTKPDAIAGASPPVPAAGPVPTAAAVSPLPPRPALEASGTYVQVGAFGQEANADRLHQRIFSALPETQSLLNKVYNGKVFQIVLGPYPDHAMAAQAANQMREKLQLPAVIFSH